MNSKFISCCSLKIKIGWDISSPNNHSKRLRYCNQNSIRMEINEELRDQVFEIIESQIKENNPPETEATYNRLKKQGFDDFQTRQLIGQCLGIELFGVIKLKKPYNNDRYVNNLLALPNEPSE
jgi:hypothetical protein